MNIVDSYHLNLRQLIWVIIKYRKTVLIMFILPNLSAAFLPQLNCGDTISKKGQTEHDHWYILILPYNNSDYIYNVTVQNVQFLLCKLI